jgi:hypothetical protein
MSANQVIEDFEKRKNLNIKNISSFVGNLSEANSTGKKNIPIAVDDNGNLAGCFCSYCKQFLNKENPWKSGVYVFPICNLCLKYVITIEEFLANKKGAAKMRTRKTMVDPDTVSVDWENFEKLVENKQAKLTLLSKRYKIYPAEMRAILSEKYGERLEFRKGRYGGIFWNQEVAVAKV